MATAQLTWTPVGGSNSASQSVQYRLKSVGGAWTTDVVLSAASTTRNVTGLDENVVYEFRILNNCNVGGPTASSVIEEVEFLCIDEVTETLGVTTLDFEFDEVGGDITDYTCNLYQSDGTTLVTSTNIAATGSGTLDVSYTGLTSNTTYVFKIIMKIDTDFSTTCDFGSFTTKQPCNPVSSLSATLS